MMSAPRTAGRTQGPAPRLGRSGEGASPLQDSLPVEGVIAVAPDSGGQLSPHHLASADWGRVRADLVRLVPGPGLSSCRLEVRSAWHAVLFVLEGGGATLALHGGREVPLRAGRLDAVPAGQDLLGHIRLSGARPGGACPTWFVLRLAPGLETAGADAMQASPALWNLRDPTLRNTVAALHRELETPLHPDPRLLADAMGMLVLARLRKGGQRGERSHARLEAPLQPWRLQRAIAYAEEHLGSQDLTVEQMAGAAGLSTFHFARAFRLATGRPPHGWLLARRAERARQLLCEGGLSLAEVALAAGFSSQSHFSGVFSRAFGCTPGAFRRARQS